MLSRGGNKRGGRIVYKAFGLPKIGGAGEVTTGGKTLNEGVSEDKTTLEGIARVGSKIV